MNRRALLESAVLAAIAARTGVARAGTVTIPATTLAGDRVALSASAVDALRRALRGSLVLPGSATYDAHRRGWNRLFDRKPALIVCCRTIDDVAAAVSFAREHSLLTAVRSGGHSFSGLSSCDGGLQIDLSAMRGVAVDPAARVVDVEPAARIGTIDAATLAHGLALPGGNCPDVAIGGYATGGGIGRLSRRFGLASDNLLSAVVVTADGAQVRASAAENEELFWAIRGGGGNFGVVASMRFRLQPFPRQVLGGRIVWPMRSAGAVLQAYAVLASRAPDLLSIDVAMDSAADADALLSVEVCWSGAPRAGVALLQPLRDAAPPLFDFVSVVDYVTLQAGRTGRTPPGRYYQRSGFFDSLSPNTIEALLATRSEAMPAHCGFAIQHMGGATGRIARDSTAFPNRNAQFWVTFGVSSATNLQADRIAAAWALLQPHTHGLYVNALMDEDEAAIRANYGGHYARLAQIKRRYDPDNLFRLNANIRPDDAAATAPDSASASSRV